MIKNASSAAALFEGWQEVLIWVVVEGVCGSLWTLSDTPKAALCENGDFLFVAGPADEPETAELLKAWRETAKGFHIIVPRDESCGQMIETLFAPRVRRTERYAFYKDNTGFDAQKLQKLTAALPQGVTVVPFDRELYGMAMQNDWSRDFCSQFRDAEDYLTRGVGYAALKDGELVGGASSYIRCSSAIEIQVETRQDWRRQGIAAACSAALITACLSKGLHPSWDAANAESARLAARLGYRSAGTYAAWFVDVQK